MTISTKCVELLIDFSQETEFDKEGYYIKLPCVYQIGDESGVDEEGKSSVCIFKSAAGYYARFQLKGISLTIFIGQEPETKNNKLVLGLDCRKAKLNNHIDKFKGACLFGYNYGATIKRGEPNYKAIKMSVIDIAKLVS